MAGKVPGNVQHAFEHGRLHETLSRVQELNNRVASSKHQQIRVTQWVRKLLNQSVANPVWRKDVCEHAALLLQMLQHGAVGEPFLKMPPQGPLPKLPRHKVAQLTGCPDASRARSRPTTLSPASKSSTQLLRRLLEGDERVSEDNAPPAAASAKKRVETQTKQIQTADQDDQWDWQRVWKGAFEKMRSELLDRAAQIQSMGAEMKELRALVAAQKHALGQEERIRDDIASRHRAELENLRSVHALEIESLKAKHKKQLEDTVLHNETLLRDRRREKELGGAFNMQSESYSDFLTYIDDFYADTLKLTQTQSA